MSCQLSIKHKAHMFRKNRYSANVLNVHLNAITNVCLLPWLRVSKEEGFLYWLCASRFAFVYTETTCFYLFFLFLFYSVNHWINTVLQLSHLTRYDIVEKQLVAIRWREKNKNKSWKTEKEIIVSIINNFFIGKRTTCSSFSPIIFKQFFHTFPLVPQASIVIRYNITSFHGSTFIRFIFFNFYSFFLTLPRRLQFYKTKYSQFVLDNGNEQMCILKLFSLLSHSLHFRFNLRCYIKHI